MKTMLCYIIGLFSKRYRLHYHTKHDGVWLWGLGRFIRDNHSDSYLIHRGKVQ